MAKYSFIADTKIEDAWSNQSLVDFAIVPAQDEVETSEIVDTLVAAYVDAPQNRRGSSTKNDVLAELYDLHANGRVLWPLGALFDASVLGELTGFRFNALVQEEDPGRFEMRKEIEDAKSFVLIGLSGIRAKNLSGSFWQFFMSLRLATTGLLDHHHIEEDHLYALVQTMKVDGLWADWLPKHVQYQLRKFGSFLRTERNEPMFASAILNSARRTKMGPRIPSVLADNQHLAWAFDAFELWLDRNVAMTKKSPRRALRLLTEFYSTIPPDRCAPEVAFSRQNVKDLLSFAKTWSTIFNRSVAVPKVLDFAEWFCLDYAMTQGLKTPLFEMKRYDVDQFLRSIPPAPTRRAEVSARPMPARFHHMLKEIISENDFEWPKSLTNGHTGLQAHWFSWTDPKTGKIKPIFCEVLPRMLMLQLELPLRNVQVRRLDSGEGDVREYDPVQGKWRKSSSVHAGFWDRQKAKNPHRGAIREIQTETGTIAGFWVNSNKTMDAVNLFDETSGYEIPWQHDDVLANVVAMRKWQEKYNPVEGPLPHAELPHGIFQDEPSQAVRALLPDRFYLFRNPVNIGPRGKEAPPTYALFLQFFLDALDELEKRLRAEDPGSDIKIITDRDDSGQPRRAIFTIHGMRSSTLTSLYMAGVPIGILSKLVAGHATILMTLRYTKFDPAHVNEILQQAWSKRLSDQRGQFDTFLKNATTEQAVKMTARLSDDGLHQAQNTYTEPSAWSRMDIGICPNGGTQCHIGGETIHRRKEKNGQNKSTHKPVPGGARNCVRCRFFVTGLPFLIALCSHATAILARIDGISKGIASLGLEVQEAKRERLSLGSAVPTSLSQRIRILEEHYYAQIDARDQALADAHATMVYVEKVRAISKSGDATDDAKLPMLLGAEGTPQVNFRESTRFELVDAVVQSSRWFPSLASAELEAERDEFLNHALWRNGYVPITLSPLSASERRRAADALAQLLLVELGATEAQNVIEGRKSLADFGLQEKLERAAAAAIGHPLAKLSLAPPSVTIEAAE